MKLIKLAVILDQKLNSGGGYQQSLNAALSTLKLNRDLVNIEFYTLTKTNIEFLKSYKKNVKKIKFAWLIKIISLIKIKPEFVLIANLIELFKALNFFENTLIKDNVDLVYFISPSYLTVNLEKLNFIYTVWDTCHRDHPEFPEVRKNNEFKVREFIYKNVLPRATSIIADSFQGKLNIIRRYNIDENRIKVIPFRPSLNLIKQKSLTKKIS